MKNRDDKGRWIKGSKGHLTHGLRHTQFYNIFNHIKGRCNRKTNHKYRLYGARGIQCLWKYFEDFRDDMYESYLEHIEKFGKKNTSIDRIDTEGNYCKENCRWATAKEQANNLRHNRFYSFQGKSMNIEEWAKFLNMNKKTLNSRINLYGWSIEKSFTTPKMFNQHK